jgi:hypothetical protein
MIYERDYHRCSDAHHDAGARVMRTRLESILTNSAVGLVLVHGQVGCAIFSRLFTDDEGFIGCELREFCISIGSY